MVDPIDTPDGGNTPTPETKQAADQTFKTFASKKEHDDYFNEMVQSRLDRERKKFANYEELKQRSDKLKEFEEKDLTNAEKLQKKVEKLTQELSERDTELTGLKLKDAKVEALLMAGATSDQIPKLLKRVSGTTPDEIAADVKELTDLGWIGQLKQDPVTKGATGGGHQVVKDSGTSKSYTRSQLKKLAADPEEYEKERESIMKAMQEGRITD